MNLRDVPDTCCYICDKDLNYEGEIVQYNAEKNWWVDTHAIICENCGARYCPIDHSVEMNLKGLKWSSAVCAKCGQTMQTGKSIIRTAGSDNLAGGVNNPEGVYFRGKHVESELVKCPNCKGKSVHANMKWRFKDRIIQIGTGIFLLIGAIWFNRMDDLELGVIILVFVPLFWGLGLLWQGLTTYPIPLPDPVRVFKPPKKVAVHALCRDCKHSWQSEMKNPIR